MNILQLKPNESKVQTRLSMAGLTSAACLYAGLGGSLAAMFSIPVSTAALIAGAAVLLLSLLLRRASFRGMILAGIAVSGMAVGLIWGDLGGGLYGIINQVSSAIGGHIGRNLARFTASESGMNYACAYLSALLAMGCVWLVQNRCTLVAALIALVLAALDVLLGVAAPALWIALLAAGLILLNLSAGILKRDSKGGAIVWLSLLLSAAIFVSGGLFLLEKHEIPGVAALRKQALALISEWRYGKDGGLPDGDFSNLGSLNQTDSVMLEVSMDKPESLYLRGFVGSEYNGNGWNAANPTSLSDGAELFYWLHRSGFYGQTQLANAALDLDDALTEEDAITISVRHIGASRAHIYAPYELISASDDLLDSAGIGDIQLYSLNLRGVDAYTLTSLPNQVKRYPALVSLLKSAEKAPAETVERYLIDESHYNQFVYEHFLEVPETTRAMLAGLLGAAPSNGHLDYGEAKQRILSWLEENVAYSETIAPHLDGDDFLEEFLEKNRQGYDVHYASAATMMMRYFGIPARYVEGYLITPDAAKAASAGEAIALDESCAHAWTEIYQDGIGWIPFETAPKYLNLMEQADVLTGTAQSEQSKTLPPDQSPQTENSLDMEEDFHDDFEDEDDEEKAAPHLEWPRIVGCILLILLLLALIAHLRRRIALSRLKRSMKLRDRREAVVNLYGYLFTLMREIYGWADCVSPAYFAETIEGDLGKDIGIKYREVMRICETAAFNACDIREEDYRLVYIFVRKTARLLAARVKGLRRLKLKYIRRII